MLPKIIYRPIDDAEYSAIKNADYRKFFDFMENRELENIRLPINNHDAYQYLRWLNGHFINDNNSILNYLLNIWDSERSEKHVRPPTSREIAIFCSRRIVELADGKEIEPDEKGTYIDFNAEQIRDAYQYWCYPIWIRTGLAGCVLKWGTFEDNVKPEDDYITWEEWNK